MHFNFDFSAVQVIWTLAFAAHLILLVVLLGRDRARFFPWFTVATALAALRLIMTRLLFGRLPELSLGEIFIPLAAISAVVSLLVLVELTRWAFGRARHRTVLLWVLAVVLLVSAIVTALGPWPTSWKSLMPNSLISSLMLVQLIAMKLSLAADLLTVCVGTLIVVFGSRYGSGWRSHTQQIAIGLSTASLGRLSVQVIWQMIARHAAPKSVAEYHRVMGLHEKLLNGASVVSIVVLVWWIVCLWIEEPGAAEPEAEAQAAEAG